MMEIFVSDIMNSYSWREREEHGKSSSVKAKVLKSKLYFLGVFDDKNIPNKYVTPLSSLLATLEGAEGTKVMMQVKESEEEGG